MANLIKILTDTTRQEWIQMTHEYFIKHVVEPLNMMMNEQLQTIITGISYPQFLMITSKCWDEQDKQPVEEDYNDEKQFEQAYDEMLPIIVLLENITSIRIKSESNTQRKQKMSEQLGLLNIILQPHLFDDVAIKINEKRNKK